MAGDGQEAASLWASLGCSYEAGLALYDAFSSSEKTMHINPGGHIQMPPFERDAVEAFYARHLGRPAR